MSPVAYTWSPFSAKIFLKIWFCKIDPLLPPHIDFNTIPYFTYGCPYRGVKEGKLKMDSSEGSSESFAMLSAHEILHCKNNAFFSHHVCFRLDLCCELLCAGGLLPFLC